jgi:undecaprenyl-diphosphatase
VALLWFRYHCRKRVYLAFFSAAVSYGLVVQFLKHVIERPRPCEVLKVHQLIVDNERGNSFPSGHASIYFSFAFAFWGTEYFWPFFTLAVLGSIGRVFVGVHYPLDILAGAIVGWVVVLILKQFFKKHFR